MKLFFLLAFLSTSAFADLCTKYDNRPEYLGSLRALLAIQNRGMGEVCNSSRILDIEIQPSQIINQQGDVIPHFAIFFHYNEESCKYMMNRADLTLTSSRCFPTW